MTNVNDLKSKFKNPALLDQALTHRSWINENPGIRGTNERLEFLGDAVLELVVSDHIYKLLPDKEEGYLTALRASVVNTKSLAEAAIRLNLGESLFLSKGEEQGGGRSNQSLLADTVEAIIGALYLDLGLEDARSFIFEAIIEPIGELTTQSLKDSKSRLQEFVQSKGYPTPKYRVISEDGPDHSKTFVVEVVVGEDSLASGSGRSKSLAEQAAAEAALVKSGAN